MKDFSLLLPCRWSFRQTLRAFVALLALPWSLSGAAEGDSRWEENPFWDKEFVRGFALLPVQEGGRVKPMSTMARFKLLRFSGLTRLKLEKENPTFAEKMRRKDAIRRSATEWLLDCFLRPEVANEYPVFLVENSDVLVTIGVDPRGERRARFSYNEIFKGRARLSEMSGDLQSKLRAETLKASEMTPVQRQLVDLGSHVAEYEWLIHCLDFARDGFQLDVNQLDADPVPPGARTSLTGLAENLEAFRAALGTNQTEGLIQAVRQIQMFSHAGDHEVLRFGMFPPADKKQEVWDGPGNLIERVFTSTEPPADAVRALKTLEQLAANYTDPEGRLEALAALAEETAGPAGDRGEYKQVPREVRFYKANWFFWSKLLFVFSFVLLAPTWLSPGSRFARAFSRIIPVLLVLAACLLSTGIVQRCLIRDRPPVTTLYDTIIFITCVAVILLLLIEWINRERIALVLATFLGAAGLFLAGRYEIKEGTDTMAPEVAVLDSNFWLSTHVTTVTIGYAAGLAAAAFSIVYLLLRLRDPFRRKKDNRYRSLTRMAYGVICFGLFFSLVGTVLGGIWANYSWGRFWGWDPKENGALMIVLMNLIILHSRLGGYIREIGLHMATIFGAIVVCYSWWGVNLLETGLHSYGFTSGVRTTLTIAYMCLYTFIVLGAGISIAERLHKKDQSRKDVRKPRRKARPPARPAKERPAPQNEPAVARLRDA